MDNEKLLKKREELVKQFEEARRRSDMLFGSLSLLNDLIKEEENDNGTITK